MEELDFENDWALLRPAEKRAQTFAVQEDDLEAAWRALKNIPDTLYLVNLGVGLYDMSLYLVHCHGEARTVKHEECWIISFDRALWLGPRARVSDKDLFHLRFKRSKGRLDMTLEDALKRLRKTRDGYLETLALNRSMLIDNIKRLEKEITSLDRHMGFGHDLEPGRAVRDFTRAHLLGTLQARVEQANVERSKLLGVLQAHVDHARGGLSHVLMERTDQLRCKE